MQIEIRNSVVSSNSEAFHFIAVLQLFYLTSSILECESGRKSASNSSSTLFLSQSRFYVYKICRKNFAKRFFFFWKRGERERTGGEKKRVTNVGHEHGNLFQLPPVFQGRVREIFGINGVAFFCTEIVTRLVHSRNDGQITRVSVCVYIYIYKLGELRSFTYLTSFLRFSFYRVMFVTCTQTETTI